MNSEQKIDSLLNLQGGYRNTVIPYDLHSIQNQILNRNKPGISYIKIETEPFKPVPKEYRSFNIFRDTNDEMSNYYILKLKYYKENNNNLMFKKSVDYILDIMNTYNSPDWVVTVYKFLERNNYI